MTISRRHLIQALSAIAATLASRRSAFADGASTTGSPRRVVFVYTPEGIWGGNSRWNQDWMVYSSQTNFTPVGMAAPLARHTDNMVVFENLSNIYDNSQPMVGGANGSGIETHEDGKPMILTNTDMVNFVYGSGKPQGPIARRVVRAGVGKMYTPAWPNLQLGVATDNTGSSTMTYLANGSPVISQNDPVAVYKGLFSAPTLANVLSRRQAVLGQVNSDLTRFMARLSPELQMRAASTVDAVQTLQQRLTATTNACVNPPDAGNVAAPISRRTAETLWPRARQ